MGNRKAREYQKQEQDRILRDQARTELRRFDDDVCLPGIGLRRFQLIVGPSFDKGSAWDARVLNSTWRLFRSGVSKGAYHEPARLLGYEELDVEGEVLRGYFNRLWGLTLPVGPLLSDSGGVDGTTYHLSLFGDLQSDVRFRWWSHSPPQWGQLVAIADEMIEAFVRLRPRAD